MTNKAFLCGIIGVVLFILGTILGGLQIPNYSHVSQLISESYAIDTPYGVALRFFVFLPSGILLFLFTLLSIKVLPENNLTKISILGIGIFYGLGTVIVSIFPCDAGFNKEFIDPSISQLIHNFSGFITYTFVPIFIILLGVSARKWANGKTIFYAGLFCGIISFLFVNILSADLKSDFVGLYQRVVESSILIFIIICSLYIKNYKSKIN
ncbi:MAG: DUF998 domain-containing protein [Chitinophagaceae bacterium]|nr:DUF998 domain-containing protein [Chitinophagaceae bacterium]MBS4043199.1 DUF998 domain-containing protein [Chitinophagaceae bacterium]